jgi:hypothetical protein
MAIGRPARAFYREILGIRVRVNLLGMLTALKEVNEKRGDRRRKREKM